ncbi:serine/threonine-protein kinase fused [Tribolium madens]|uniref:serine/threonine-protein kinase fused n=1 Tax=Tribolium madens TaxID=41895 RepID=UPI001CF750DB|nr:serine/threonine-protein kinase fused [Tribolium madens]
MSGGSVSKQKQSFSNLKNEMDKYEVIKLLGEGSFGRVYKAKVVADSTFVALKVICKGRRSNKEIVGLRRECEIQRHLHHPNIIQMLDSFETPSEIVVVTEFAQKELNTVLGKEGYLSEERATPIIWDLVSALNYLHSHRVLHRDLKPQNILIDSKNRAKLCDFGFARNMSTGTHVLTSIKGTPLYMAPELIEEQPYDYKADLWSLGCIMYELLVGAPPFCTASILHLIRLIRHEQIRWPTFISENCVSFLKGLLQKDPSKRINWEEILNHDFVKGHILICNDSTNMPLTKALSENTLHVQEQQRKDHMCNKAKSSEPKVSPQDMKNNNLSSQNSSIRNDTFIEESHPIETEEWIVFLQKSMEEVIGGELTSLTQTYLANIIVSPLRNTNTSPKVLTYVAKLLSLPFALRGVSHEMKEQIKKVYLEVKLVPNLIYSSKKIMKVFDSSSDETYKDVSDLTEDDFQALECIYVLLTHLVHLDNEFLSQLCDSIAVLNVYSILKSFLLICKSRLQLVMDLLAILTHVLRVFPENFELIDRIVLNEGKTVNFVELLRHNNPLMQERTCFFLLFLGKHSPANKMEVFWNETVRETLEALMYDSIGSVRNAADRTVEELRCKDFYKPSIVKQT